MSKLTIIRGRSGTGKTEKCLDEILLLLNETPIGSPLIYITPEQFTLQAELSLADKLESGGFMRAQVISFSRLAHNYFEENGMRKGNYLDQISKNIYIRTIINELYKESFFDYFAAIYNRNGFIQKISSCISEMKRYGITPDALRLNSANMRNKRSCRKIEELSVIYEKYESNLASNELDPDDDLTFFSHYGNNWHYLKDAEVWIDGFTDFTPQERDVLFMLIETCKRVTVTVTGDDAFVFRRSSITVDILKNYCIGKVDFNIENLNKSYRYNSSDLNHIERSYFKYPSVQSTANDGGLQIYKCETLFEESEFIAETIQGLVAQGYKYSDIVVICRNLEEYESVIPSSFNKLNIPFFIDTKDTVSNKPLCVFILSSLAVLISSYSYDNMLAMLRTGIMPISKDETDILDNCVLKNGIKGYNWSDDTMWTRDPDNAALLCRLRKQIYDPLNKLISELRKKITAETFKKCILDYLEETGADESILLTIENLKKDGKYRWASELEQSHKFILDVFDKMTFFCGDGKYSGVELSEMFKTGIETCRIGVIPESKELVTVSTADRIRSRKVKAAFIPGVNDGIFPSNVSGNGLITDTERYRLSELGITMAPTSGELLFDEQYLIYSSISMPSDKLILSYNTVDISGKVLSPSSIIYRMSDILPNTHLSTYRDVSRDGNVSSITDQNNDSADNGISINPGLYLDDSKHINISVTSIEKYYTCPFSYYINKILFANERDIYKISSPETGTLAHRILCEAGKLLAKEENRNKIQTLSDARDFISPIFENVMSRTLDIYKDNPGGIFVSARIKEIVSLSLLLLSRNIAETGYRPVLFEATFGVGEKIPPVIIQAGDKTCHLNGIIDRVDLFTDKDGIIHARVADYKTGSTDFDASKLFNGLSLQLPVYLEAICNYGNFKPDSAQYVPVHDAVIDLSSNNKFNDSEYVPVEELEKKLTPKVISDSEEMPIQKIIDFSNDKIAQAASEIFKGSFPIKPAGYSGHIACNTCKYSGICKIELAGSSSVNKIKRHNDYLVFNSED